VSLTILFTIIAISIGGIGIAAMGSAVGLPAAALATVLGTIGAALRAGTGWLRRVPETQEEAGMKPPLGHLQHLR